jgi:hypothetical protein
MSSQRGAAAIDAGSGASAMPGRVIAQRKPAASHARSAAGSIPSGTITAPGARRSKYAIASSMTRAGSACGRVTYAVSAARPGRRRRRHAIDVERLAARLCVPSRRAHATKSVSAPHPVGVLRMREA